MSMRLPICLCVFLLMATGAFSQSFSRPKTFLNLGWGSSRAEVLKAIADAGGTVPETAYDSTEPKMEVTGGKFAGQDVVAWSLEFIHGKLVAAAVSLKPSDGNTGALFRQVLQELTRKYGPHPAERKYSTLTADQKKVYTQSGQRAPNRGTAVIWKFPPNLKDKEALTLSCEHHPPTGVDSADETQYLVTLRYSHDSLKTQLSAETGVTEGTDSKSRSVKAKDL